MRRGAGKAKGSAFERQVCKDLSLWVTRGARDDVFWRSAMSGGRATVSSKKGKNMAHVSGDLCAVHPDGFLFVSEFFVECKFYRDLTFAALLTSNSGLVARFWEKAREQAQENKKLPMLILKQNQMPALLGVCSVGEEVLDLNLSGELLVQLPQLGLNLYPFDKALHHGTPPSKESADLRPASHRKLTRRI